MRNIEIRIMVLLLLFTTHSVNAAEEFGKYIGSLRLEVVEKPNLNRPIFKTLSEFMFEDATGKVWTVPTGYDDLDGASIPKGFWSFVGGPLSGYYLKASVIHDYYCDVKIESAKDTHRVFYGAMRASGVSKKKASIMYIAVKSFGPTWENSSQRKLCLSELVDCAAVPPPDNIKQTRSIDVSDLEEIERELHSMGVDETSNMDLYLDSLDTIANSIVED